MPYVSCRYDAPPPADAPPPTMQMIICTDENGQEWFVPPDSDEGSFRAFIEEGGEIEPYEPPEEPPPPEPEPEPEEEPDAA